MEDRAVSGAAPMRLLLVFPRFNPNSFWALKDSCEVAGAKAPSPPLGLLTVAAMVPQDWEIRLVNCNVRDLADAALAWADLVMTGGGGAGLRRRPRRYLAP